MDMSNNKWANPHSWPVLLCLPTYINHSKLLELLGITWTSQQKPSQGSQPHSCFSLRALQSCFPRIWSSNLTLNNSLLTIAPDHMLIYSRCAAVLQVHPKHSKLSLWPPGFQPSLGPVPSSTHGPWKWLNRRYACHQIRPEVGAKKLDIGFRGAEVFSSGAGKHVYQWQDSLDRDIRMDTLQHMTENLLSQLT